jgi:hypothetical protein
MSREARKFGIDHLPTININRIRPQDVWRFDVSDFHRLTRLRKIEVGEYRVTRHGRRNGIHVDLVYFSIADGISEEAVEVEAGFKNLSASRSN